MVDRATLSGGTRGRRSFRSVGTWPWRLVTALVAVLLLAGGGAVFGQAQNIVVQIGVEGETEVETGLILSNLATRVGDPMDRNKVTRDIKTIFELGFFQDVSAYAEEIPGQGIKVTFVVTEKPRISDIQLTGVTLLTKQIVADAVTVKIGSVYDAFQVDKALESLRAQYRKKGYFSVRVRSELEKRTGTDYVVKIIVRETPKVYVTQIETQGNTVFPELEIRRLMQTAEVDCFDWINDSGILDEQKINADLQTVASKYLAIGYIRLFIDKPAVRIQHNPEFSRVDVKLSMREGPQYFTGQLDITGDILGDKQDLMDVLRLVTGQPYNPFNQNQDVFNLTEIYQEQGYAFARVIPDARINDETRIVDVTYKITRGEKAYIGRLEVQGNKETRDYVVRRELEVRENELFNGRGLRQSQENLRKLGYFKPALSMTQEPTQVGNVLDIDTKLEETQTGTFQAQLGYSEQTLLSLALSLSKGNLFGRGQTLRLQVEGGQRGIRENYSIDFIEPHLAESDVSSDSSFAYRTVDDFTELNRGTFTEVRLSQGFGFPFFRVFKLSFTLEGVDRTFSREQFDPVKLRSVTPAISYNTINHPFFPSAGSQLTFSAAQVGGIVLGGTTEYRRYRILGQRFLALNENSTLVLMGRARASWLEQVGGNLIPAEERFRLGGITTLRGYEFLEVGGPYGRLEQELNGVRIPLLDENGDPVLNSNGVPISTEVDRRTAELTQEQLDSLRGGGIFERLFNLELLFPLAGDYVRGVVFYDAGQVNAERSQYELLGEREPGFFDLKQSAGAGIRLITPLGVFRFEYGAKLTRSPGESPDKFDFTISTLF